MTCDCSSSCISVTLMSLPPVELIIVSDTEITTVFAYTATVPGRPTHGVTRVRQQAVTQGCTQHQK